MTQTYDKGKFLEAAQAAEAQRLTKQGEWNQKNEGWIKEHGPIPFQVPKLLFDGK